MEHKPTEGETKTIDQVVVDAFKELWDTAVAFVKAPKALMWGINFPYLFEGLVYFGILTILGKYCSENVGLSDLHAGWVYSVVTAGITLAMLFLGGVSDKIGVRKALVLAFGMFLVGRGLIALSGSISLENGLFSPMFFVMSAGLLIMVIAYGLYQPAAYAAVKRYTNPKTAAMGYAVVYALMNLGAFFSGFISPVVRRHFEEVLPPNGLAAVFWVYTALIMFALIVTVMVLTKRTDEEAVARVALETAELAKKDAKEDAKEEDKESPGDKAPAAKINHLPFIVLTAAALAALVTVIAVHTGTILMVGVIYVMLIIAVILFSLGALVEFLRQRPDHPFRDPRFTFFIFILIPVQTLFAHNWLTIPYYLDRAFRGNVVSDYFELFSNLNPILIFVLAPIVAGLTARANVYKMMIIGTLVMAAPTFLLVLGPYVVPFLVFILLMSIGEAMWQPRFLQWIAEVAPPGKAGLYMGIGQFPWFLTKFVTGLYSGYFVANYIPDPAVASDATMNTGAMWLIYACIAMISPVALILAKGWMEKGMKVRHEG